MSPTAAKAAGAARKKQARKSEGFMENVVSSVIMAYNVNECKPGQFSILSKARFLGVEKDCPGAENMLALQKIHELS